MGEAAGQGAASGAASGAATGATIGGPWGALVGAVIGGGVGAIGGAGVDRAKTRLKNTITEYMNQLQNLDMPRYEDLKLTFEKYSKGEPLTAEQLQSLQDVNSEVGKIYQDKGAKQTQLEALAQMKIRARGGLTLQDKADLLNAQKDIDRQSIGTQKSIMQNMAARGQAGSGAELAARMAANQNQVSQTSQNALNVAARAQGNAMQSLKDSASLGRQIGQDQLDFDTMKAKSADETRRSNLERLQATMQYNIGNRNLVAANNWNRINQISDKNVNLSNSEQQSNKQILWNDYVNQKNRLNEKYKGDYGAIKQKEAGLEDANRAADGYNSMLNSVGSLAGGMSGGSSTPSTNKSSEAFDVNKYVGSLGGSSNNNWSMD